MLMKKETTPQTEALLKAYLRASATVENLKADLVKAEGTRDGEVYMHLLKAIAVATEQRDVLADMVRALKIY